MNKLLKITTPLAGFLLLSAATVTCAAPIDAPHNETFSIQCGDCHSYSMWWNSSPTSAGDTTYGATTDAVCFSCHDGIAGSAKLPHSSASMSDMHNPITREWSTQCVDCHDPHYQAQLNWRGMDDADLYLVTGTIEADSLIYNSADHQSTFDYQHADAKSEWADSSLWTAKSTNDRGLVLLVSRENAENSYLLTSVIESVAVTPGQATGSGSITVQGQIDETHEGANFALVYGQLIKDELITPAGNSRQVKFFNGKNPLGGFTNTETPPTGICQVCHTLTDYWRNDGSLNHHNPGSSCSSCHVPTQGFKPEFPQHDSFINTQSACTICHTGADSVLNIHKGNCSHCHTEPPELADAATRANAITIAIGDCFTCHGSTFSHPNANHNRISMAATCLDCHDNESLIDDTHLSNCLICHDSTLPSVIATISAGKAGMNVDCLSCHDGTADGAGSHGTTPSTAAAVHDMFALTVACSECHVSATIEERLNLHMTKSGCATCHSSTKPSVIETILKGRNGNIITCASCHDGTADGAISNHGTTPETAGAVHDMFGVAANCTACHEIDTVEKRLALHPSCSTCHGSSEALVTATIAAGRSNAAVNCEHCHGVAYTHPTALHQKVNTVARCNVCHLGVNIISDIHKGNCVHCHTSIRPEVVEAIGSRDGGNCLTCHTARHPAFGYAAETFENMFHAATGTGDCTLCHVPSIGFSPHNNLQSAAFCQPCHTGSAFLDILTIHKNDCTKCHLTSDTYKLNQILDGRIEPGIIATCETCHGVHYPHPSAQHTNVTKTAQCIVCHAGSNVITDVHRSNCAGCHTSTRQVVVEAINSRAGGNCQNCHTSAHPTAFSAELTHNIVATGDCSICHYPQYPAPAHNNLSSAENCQPCHIGTSFSDILGFHKNDCTKCHLTTDNGKLSVILVGVENPGTPADCETCHGAAYPHPNALHNKVLATDECVTCHRYSDIIPDIHYSNCTGCHTSTLPEVIDAISTRTGGTCRDCHVADHVPSITTGTLHDISYNRDNSHCLECHEEGLISNKPHNNLSSAAACSGCHPGSGLSAIVEIHSEDCTKCHLSGLIGINTLIEAGKITPGGTMVTCESCHTGEANFAVNHGSTPETAASSHDRFQGTPLCAGCHDSASAATRLGLHLRGCTVCHNSNKTVIQTTIATGRAGTPIACDNCHTGAADAAASHGSDPVSVAPIHNNFGATTDCSQCHPASTVEERIALHLDCLTCHGSGKLSIQATIDSGRNGTPIDCEDCHTGNIASGAFVHGSTPVSVAAVHDFFNHTESCATCHRIESAEERIAVHPECTTCHSSLLTTVVDAVLAGRAGVVVDCSTCHTGSADAAPLHSTSPAAVAPVHDHFMALNTCGSCHPLTTTLDRIMLHPDCTTCHSSMLSSVTTAISEGRNGIHIDCGSCHTGDANGAAGHGLTPSTAADVHNQFQADSTCANCHASDTAEARLTLHAACATCHESTASTIVDTVAAGRAGISVNCANCHTGALNGAPAHGTSPSTIAAAHDYFATSSACDSCHPSGTNQQRLALHPDCFTCHSSTKSVVAEAIASGRAGTTVNCQTCHSGDAAGANVHGTTPETVAFVHDQFGTAATCIDCHDVSSAEKRLLLHPDCTTCHNSNKSAVVNGIAAGRSGSPIDCETCHNGSTNGAAGHGVTPETTADAHDMFKATPACSFCHPNGDATQRVALHRDCTVCHSSTRAEVVNSIANGRAGSSVQCSSCHTGNLAATHHANPNVAAGNCTWCHADIRSDWTIMRPGDNGGGSNLPTQLPCAECHVRATGDTIYIDRIRYNNGYSSQPSRTVQHTINGVPSGTIYNYGICFSCHNGVDAPSVSLYHAKPSSAASRDRYDNMRYAPGRGTFNLMWSDFHGREESNFGRERYRGSDNNFQSPAISFQMIDIPCGNFNGCSGSNSEAVPILPALTPPAPVGSTVHNYFQTASTCSGCHVSSEETERTVGLHSACATCHLSSKLSVVDTILAGINGTTVVCEHCHNGIPDGALVHGTSPAAAETFHDRLNIANDCTVCHNVNSGSFLEIYSLHRNDCSKCHGSSRPEVLDAITAGRDGTSVNCTNCHGNNHHDSAEAKAGNCTWCHADPRSDWYSDTPGDYGSNEPRPTQLACVECHVSVSSNDTITIRRTTSSSAVHTLPGITARYIYNYGACLSCHDGVKAASVRPFHGKPASLSSNNRCSDPDAVGRGIFNLFYQEFNRDGSRNESEHSNCRNYSRRWDNRSNPGLEVNAMLIGIPFNNADIPVFPAKLKPVNYISGGFSNNGYSNIDVNQELTTTCLNCHGDRSSGVDCADARWVAHDGSRVNPEIYDAVTADLTGATCVNSNGGSSGGANPIWPPASVSNGNIKQRTDHSSYWDRSRSPDRLRLYIRTVSSANEGPPRMRLNGSGSAQESTCSADGTSYGYSLWRCTIESNELWDAGYDRWIIAYTGNTPGDRSVIVYTINNWSNSQNPLAPSLAPDNSSSW